MPAPTPPVRAATTLLVRDGAAGLEVFLVERHRQIEFAEGALVFPGGKLEPVDRDPLFRRHATFGLDPAAFALRVAAIRETFEESGVLLARTRGGGLVDAARLRGIEARHRARLREDARWLRELVEQESLELACDLLVSFAHWITPEFMPKRFDTHFFLAAAPPGQAAAHDGEESVDSLWVTPAEAVALAESGRRTIIFPTLMNLRKLGRSRWVPEALERARREPVVTVLPRAERGPDGNMVRIPPEAGYDVSSASVDLLGGPRSRRTAPGSDDPG